MRLNATALPPAVLTGTLAPVAGTCDPDQGQHERELPVDGVHEVHEGGAGAADADDVRAAGDGVLDSADRVLSGRDGALGVRHDGDDHGTRDGSGV